MEAPKVSAGGSIPLMPCGRQVMLRTCEVRMGANPTTTLWKVCIQHTTNAWRGVPTNAEYRTSPCIGRCAKVICSFQFIGNLGTFPYDLRVLVRVIGGCAPHITPFGRGRAKVAYIKVEQKPTHNKRIMFTS